MTLGAKTLKLRKRGSSQKTKFEEERDASKAGANQDSFRDVYTLSASTKPKRRLHSKRTGITKREDSLVHSRKPSSKSSEKSLPKRVPRKKKFMVQQEDETSVNFDDRDKLIKTDPQGPKRKRIREATCNGESQVKTLPKARKRTKSKTKFLPKLTNIREENSQTRKLEKTPVDGLEFAAILQREKNESQLQQKELYHDLKPSLQNVKMKAKKQSLNLGRTFEKMRTRKISLKEKSRAGKQRNAQKKPNNLKLNALKPNKTHLSTSSHALHSLRESTSSRDAKNTLSDSALKDDRTEVIQDEDTKSCSNITIVDIHNNNVIGKIESKETTKALKVASDTSGFVRSTLKAVEDSKSTNFRINEGIMSQRKKEDVNVDKKPNKIAEMVAERYKSTLEALQSKQTLTAQKLIEELELIPLALNGSDTGKVGKLGKRHTNKSTRNFPKGEKDRLYIGKEIAKQSYQADLTNDGSQDAKHIKIGRRSTKNSGNKIIDKLTLKQGASAIVATKKSKSPSGNGFHRLAPRAGGNKEFESVLAQIVSSHDSELGWTKEQEKALQDAYLAIKQPDGDFWQLISREVPGRTATECYNKFYSRDSTPALKSIEPTAKCMNENEFSSCVWDDSNEKDNSLKVLKKQKQLEAQKTIHNILRHVENMDDCKIDRAHMDNHPDIMQDEESTSDRMDDEKAVILQSNPSKDLNNAASCLEAYPHASSTKGFFENIVISGASSVSDKENSQPHNGQEINNKKPGVSRIELTLKQASQGDLFLCDGRPKTSIIRKKKIIKTSNVYLHSKDALDFGDSTLDAIQRAKEELRNVFSRAGSRGGSFFDNESIQIEE